jgi:predicted DNA-binding protein
MADELRARRPASAEQLARELAEIADIADELGLIGDAGAAEVADSAFDYLDTTRWSLADYVLRGDRTRRMVNAPNRLIDAALAERSDGDLERAARALRSRADELSEQVCRTNTVVARWLVAHRVAVANPCYLDSNVLFNRLRHGDLDPSAISEDPLYLLVCHLHDVLEAVDEWDDADAPALQHLRAQLTLPLRVVQDEMVAAMAHHAAAIALARAVARLEAG